jgi:transcriptional regulator with GAF, ATPase, and Fis domain
MTQGKDGYDMLVNKPMIVDEENGLLISTMMRNYFRKLCVVSALSEHLNLKKDVVSTWKQFAKEKHHEQAENQQKAAELSENQTSIKDLLGLSNKYLDRAHHCPVINITEQGRIKMVQNK